MYTFICPVILEWFRSYLQPRQFKVSVNDTYSSEINLKYSVPQGPCVEATIFNLYCSSLGDTVSTDLSLSGFADDQSIRSQFKASDRQAELTCKAKTEDTMLTVKSWLNSMRLKMNPSKTEFIYFGDRLQLRKCTETSINMTGDEVCRTDCIMYLGTMLNSET